MLGFNIYLQTCHFLAQMRHLQQLILISNFGLQKDLVFFWAYFDFTSSYPINILVSDSWRWWLGRKTCWCVLFWLTRGGIKGHQRSGPKSNQGTFCQVWKGLQSANVSALMCCLISTKSTSTKNLSNSCAKLFLCEKIYWRQKMLFDPHQEKRVHQNECEMLALLCSSSKWS